jgi:hypothetical protein
MPPAAPVAEETNHSLHQQQLVSHKGNHDSVNDGNVIQTSLKARI